MVFAKHVGLEVVTTGLRMGAGFTNSSTRRLSCSADAKDIQFTRNKVKAANFSKQ
jgi:hypothetical protein